MRLVIALFGLAASGLLALMWVIGWILLRGELPVQGGLRPVLPLFLAAVAGVGALLHLAQGVAVALGRRFPGAGRAGLAVAGLIAALLGPGVARGAPPTEDFWPFCLMAGALGLICAAMPPPGHGR